MKFLLGVLLTPSPSLDEPQLEAYYQATVRNFLTAAYRFQDVPVTVFISGPFLEWLKDHHSEFLAVLTEMVKRKQVEMLSGGFFNPLLPLVPASDRLGQIEALTTQLRKYLGRRPRGLWLTKTIWDASVISHLSGSGIEYTFLDENDFARIGLTEEDLAFPRVTENQGKILTVFPVDGEVARQMVRGDMGAFNRAMEKKISYGESFYSVFLPLEGTSEGGTFQSDQGFLDLFESLRTRYPETDCVNPALFFKKNTRALERSYFAATTYDEMTSRFDLPVRKAAHQQSWRQFLTDFEASNRLYSKMVYTHILVTSLRGDKYKKKSAGEELWKAQDIHGYLPTLNGFSDRIRKKAFVSLLNAESLLRDRAHFQPTLSAQDFDLDGVREFLYQGKYFNFYVDSIGGQVFEWDSLDNPWNYVDATDVNSELSTKPQMFVDRFFHHESPHADASDFFFKEYKASDLNRDQKKLQLVAVADLSSPQGKQPLRLIKTYSFHERELFLEYELELLSGPPWVGEFTSETFLSFPGAEEGHFQLLGETDQAFGAVCHDLRYDLEVAWDWSPVACWDQDIWTSTSARGSEYQAHRLAPRWKVHLEPGQKWSGYVRLKMKEPSL